MNIKSYKQLTLITFIFISLISSTKNTYGQANAAQFIKAGAADAKILAGAYLNPLFKGIGFGMNSAWYNSAKSKNLGRFDLRIQATAAIVPTKDRSFDINTLGLQKVELLNPLESGLTPTLFGNSEAGPEVIVRQTATINGTERTVDLANFSMPQGVGFSTVPSPQVQLTVGLIMNTDISVRFSPKIGSNSAGKISSWGLGVKKELTPYFKGSKTVPFDLSIAFGYNQINYNYQIAKANEINDQRLAEDLNQRVETQFSGYTIDAIISKQISVITPFLSIGYNSANTKLGLLGKYNFRSGIDLANTTNILSPRFLYRTLSDPITINQKSISSLRANLGFALQVSFFRLYAAYSIGEYQAFSSGIGFGI